MLTARERECLQLICTRLDRDGVAPSFAEMLAGLDLASKSSVHRLITGLESKGYIRRLKNRPRAIEVLKRPEGRVVLAEQAGFPQGRLAMAERIIAHFVTVTDPDDRPGPKAFLDAPVEGGMSLGDVRRAARVFLGREAGGATGAAISTRKVAGHVGQGAGL